MLKLWILLVSCCLNASAWLNDYDKELNFQCPDGEYISAIRSEHSNYYDDRVWDFTCRSGYVSDECVWSDFVNENDKLLNYVCPGNGIVTGLKSEHSNWNQDRRWKVRCCGINTKPGTNCQLTSYINQLDKKMDKDIQDNKAIIGLYSTHSNHNEDRQWKLKLCDFAMCKAEKITVIDNVQPTYAGERIVGIATIAVCSASASPLLKLESTDSVEETVSLSVTKGIDFTYGTEITIGASATGGFLGSGATVSFEVSQSFSSSVSASTSSTKETSVGTSSTAGAELAFTSPGAALLLAVVTKYEFDRTNLDAEVSVVCDDGQRFTRREKMALKSTTYGRTHVMPEVGSFQPRECDDKSKACIRGIRGDLAMNLDQLKKEFRACFQNSEQFTG